MTQPNKREELAAMRLEEFKEHLRTLAGGTSEQISGAPRPSPLLVRNRKKAARGQKALRFIAMDYLESIRAGEKWCDRGRTSTRVDYKSGSAMKMFAITRSVCHSKTNAATNWWPWSHNAQTSM